MPGFITRLERDVPNFREKKSIPDTAHSPEYFVINLGRKTMAVERNIFLSINKITWLL